MSKRNVLLLIGFALPLPAAAQISGAARMTGPNNTTNSGLPLGSEFGIQNTPAMERQRLRRAQALQQEALELQRQDGGALTPQNRRYIREKANDILGVSTQKTGSLISTPSRMNPPGSR